mgnify:CR=1 FL=1
MKGAASIGQDPNKIDFTGSKFDPNNQGKRDKYDWSKDKIDLKATEGGHSNDLAKRMITLEKSFKTHMLKKQHNHNMIVHVAEDAEQTEEEEREKQ